MAALAGPAAGAEAVKRKKRSMPAATDSDLNRVRRGNQRPGDTRRRSRQFRGDRNYPPVSTLLGGT